jgi:hypothetical protein
MKLYAHEPHVDGTTKYAIGDEREVEDETQVQHLIELGVLGKDKPKALGAAAKNKAEGAAEKNK